MLASLQRLFSIGRPPLWGLLGLATTMLLSAALSVLPPLFIGRIIDALQHREFSEMLRQLAWYAFVTALFGAIQLIDGYSSTVLRETLGRNLRIGLISKLGCVRFNALSKLTPGEIINRATGDVDVLLSQLQYSLFPTLMSLCTLAATIAAVVRLDPLLALVAIAFAFLTLLPARVSAPRLAALHRSQAQATDELYGELQDGATLQGLAILRNAYANSRRIKRFSDVTAKIFELGVRQSVLGEGTALASTLVNMVGPAAIMALGAYLAIKGQITPGTIVTILIYQSRMSGPFTALSSLQVTLATIGVGVRRLFDVLDLPEERSGNRPFAAGALAIQSVSMTRDERTVLDKVTLTVNLGQHVAIIGPSGAGKSTLASLIVRLYDPDSGYLSVGGVDLPDIELGSLRAAVVIVPQDPLVFDASFFENITAMSPGENTDELSAVIALCQLDGVVARLPEGMRTRLGQRGFRLSGGERQRICLARALLQGPQLLILDEALSGVDIEMERQILANLRRQLEGRTFIAITHRIRSLGDFDRIFVLQRGQVTAEGTLEELRTHSAFVGAS
jgi:ATP-binding cassette, subfamily B, bacterial